MRSRADGRAKPAIAVGVLDDGPDVLLAANARFEIARPDEFERLLALGVVVRPELLRTSVSEARLPTGAS